MNLIGTTWWQQQIQQKLHQSGTWLERLKTDQAPYLVYGFLSSLVLYREDE